MRGIDKEWVLSALSFPAEIIPDTNDPYRNIMKVKYDKEQDILYFSFSEEPIFESDEEKKGFILDYSSSGKIVGIEVLNASRQVDNPAKLEYEIA